MTADFFRELPESLPENQPYYYLSILQAVRCDQLPELKPYAPFLPGTKLLLFLAFLALRKAIFDSI
jgi:hypothetical protein